MNDCREMNDHPETIGRKVLVLGCPGSGKSSLACRLAEKTGLPLIHLDNVWWRPDRTHLSREEFDRRLAELLREERWILDGDYSRTHEVRIRASDTVIFLDYSEEQCLQGVTERVGKQRRDIPWTESSLDPELIALIRRYRAEVRPALLRLLSGCPEKQQLIFTNRAEADAWLTGLPTFPG